MKVYALLLVLSGVLAGLNALGLGWLVGLTAGLVVAIELAILVGYSALFVRDVLEARRPRRPELAGRSRRRLRLTERAR